MADKKGCTTSQLALAWLLKQDDDVIPIPGTKQIKHLEENWAALDVAFTAEDGAEVRDFCMRMRSLVTTCHQRSNTTTSEILWRKLDQAGKGAEMVCLSA